MHDLELDFFENEGHAQIILMDTRNGNPQAIPSTDLQPRGVTDLSPLRDLRNLRILSVSRDQLTDVSPLAGLANLEIVNVISNRIREVGPLVSRFLIDEGGPS
jgi:Leucine-rich repeat (LRR) protein